MSLQIIYEKLKEVLFAVLPITLIVIILNFTVAPLNQGQIFEFIRGSIFIIVGLTTFLFGVDIGISPIGRYMGAAIVKSNKLYILIGSGLILGFLISIAEPDLHILADQVSQVTGGQVSKLSIVVVVSIGIAFLLTLGFVRMVYNFSIKIIFTILYAVVFLISLFVPNEFLSISFDSSGATTGAMTVPFVLALAIGISALRKNRNKSDQDSFGLVGIASVGAILGVMLMSIFKNITIATQGITLEASHGEGLIQQLAVVSGEVLFALLPIGLLFFLLQKTTFNLTKTKMRSITMGLVYTFFGLVIFLIGVNTGFMDVGKTVGELIAAKGSTFLLVGVGFILGVVTILAEPAVYVLTHQIEDVTSGYVTKRSVLITLSIGVGLAIAISMLRIIIQPLLLWHILLPGYLMAITLMYFVPELFVGMAFDSGGVASGPMTATFILAFAQGAANAIEGADVLLDGFGMIAVVAMTPIIAILVLGLIFKYKSKKEGVVDES